jgi:hypothetical protein
MCRDAASSVRVACGLLPQPATRHILLLKWIIILRGGRVGYKNIKVGSLEHTHTHTHTKTRCIPRTERHDVGRIEGAAW